VLLWILVGLGRRYRHYVRVNSDILQIEIDLTLIGEVNHN
jgi:hypothetical protein